MLEIKIRKSIVEEYIQKFADDIQHMDDKHLPEVILELQAEEAVIQGIKNHKTITAFSKEAMEQVFHCWFSGGDGDDWFETMVNEELAMIETENA